MEYVGAILGALAFGAPVVENIGKLAQGSRHVIDLADRVIGIFRRRVPQAQQSAAIAAQMTSLVALPPEKQSQFIDRIIENELADKPPEEKAAAKEFVALTIAKIQATFTRPEDPTGQTVPQRFNPLKAVNLAITFPTRLSRFKVGDRPPGAEDYILVEQLAIGGFGEVWKARHEEMQYTFFVFKFCLDPESQQAIFANELETIEIVQSKLKNNPHIVKLISCKLKCDAPWLLYEHIPGGTLLELAASWPAEISARTANAIEQMKILTETLDKCHNGIVWQGKAKQVVHRDMKPENVLIDDDLTLKITDYGISAVQARFALDEVLQATAATNTTPDQILWASTPLYASPQQKSGFDKPHPADDVYSLGVMLYQMIVGDLRRPLHHDYREILERKHASPELLNLIIRSVASERADRYQHAGQMLAALKALPPKLIVEPQPVIVLSEADNAKEHYDIIETKAAGAKIKKPSKPGSTSNAGNIC